MTSKQVVPADPSTEEPADEAAVRPPGRWSWAGLLTNYAAVGALIGFIVLFSILRPETFPTLDTFQTIVLTQSVLVIVALGLIAPLAAGEFDLSIGASLSFAAIVSAKLVSSGTGVALTLLIVLGAGIAIGLVNSFLIVRLEVSSFIATLGTGIILEGSTLWASGGSTVFEGIGDSFTSIGNNEIFGFLPLPGLYIIVVALALWYVLERTPLGREVYVTGYGRDAARLAGIRVERRVVLALIISASLAAMAGFLHAANLGSASPGVGNAFLLPAFAAAFLGSTAIKAGRFNVAGTLVAAALLSVGITGLLLMGAQSYVQQFFYGGALIVSVAFAQLGVRRLRSKRAAAT